VADSLTNSSKALAELAQGEAFGIFIDDTGSPGLKDTPSFLHPRRKTWVAVVVPPTSMPEILEQFPNAIDGLREFVGAHEFHFADIYGGRKEFEKVPLEKRLGIFQFMAWVFKRHALPIFVQTLDPTSRAVGFFKERFAAEFGGSKRMTLGPLHIENHEHLALILLLMRLRSYLRDELHGATAHVFLDEGLRPAGRIICIPGLQPEVRDGAVYSESSAKVMPLQLADFAAFGLNRMQLVLGKDSIGPLDYAIGKIYEELAGNWQNIPAKVIDFGYLEATRKRPN
jgi:hypothetical protein